MTRLNTKDSKRIRINLLIMVLIMLFCSTISYAYPAMYSVRLKNVAQQKTYWCWAACAVSILDYYNKSVTQTNFVTTVKGSAVNSPASDSEVRSGLSRYGLSSTQTYSYLSFNTIVTEIYSYERPIYAGWSWSSGGGHAVVINGYDEGSTNYVEYMDPGTGTKYQDSYAWFRGGSGYNHVWDGTLYKFN